MDDAAAFYYNPDPDESLSTEVVNAIAMAHDEDVIDQKWVISDDINTDALDGLFQQHKHKHKITLQFEADTASVTIVSDDNGNPEIKIESRR